MATKRVSIKATDEARKLAAKATEIQDACNPLAVTNFLLTVLRHFLDGREHGQEYSGSDFALQNPVSIAVLNKLNHLADTEQSKTECFTACMDLADGRDVEWEVNIGP
ncbi:MAG: hypothetical protein GXX96_35790 [Planctomycetaceae bacterium]|nr:hypothetical protein [Planctomycetaceae bacterium]